MVDDEEVLENQITSSRSPRSTHVDRQVVCDDIDGEEQKVHSAEDGVKHREHCGIHRRWGVDEHFQREDVAEK